ncbi:glycine--tRNA ligase subunit beta [Sphingomonas fennica]|uniref:Glycine--tRNA ligase beta subunit n=1 Tax=Edaphosphingomonas fennica TaxID=114404 RepID=A0A2T4HNI4_9SPHN|nr:glycine--tRNA ligase subunit beta [Sphingomonas fennica]PTD17371.1 glycine--tRNA ligase subunit beta [Sphingomonas fennica]
MMDFLLELRSEEIPARMQEKACADLARLFEGEIARAGLKADGIETYAAPRRLALIARGLPVETAAVSEELKGPRADAPAQALEGFLKKTGLTRDQLVERTDPKGNAVLFAVIDKPGRATAEVLAEAIPAIVAAFPWPKSMRWGAASASSASLRWVRPLQGIVALFGNDVVDCAVDGIRSGAATLGHRFHHPGEITIGNAGDYAAKLRAAHVILDPKERQAIIRDRAAALAAEAGLAVVPDEGLVAENAGLTEWPVPLLGRFDAAFLEVPREVIQLTLRTNQKYFVLNDQAGRLAAAFICVANIDAKDGGAAITAGNGKVLAARLSDARFFWEQDLKVPLAENAKKLDQIVFHEKLGTVADKVDRVAKLARWLVESGVVMPASAGMTKEALADLAEQAARLAKADLVTGMVGEFPELQGIMGGYYARAEGLPDAVADAIRDHYKPVGQGDEVPTAPVTVAVSLADKLDTALAFWFLGEKPTGSKDPFAIRRAGLGVIRTLQTSDIRLPVKSMLAGGLAAWITKTGNPSEVYGISDKSGAELTVWRAIDKGARITHRWKESSTLLSDEKTERTQRELIRFDILPDEVLGELRAFFADRLKVQQREAGVRHDLIDAVFALGGEDDLVRLLARVKALQAFVSTEDGRNLLAGYKRAANILKKEGVESLPVTSAKAGASGEGAGVRPHEMPAFAGMTDGKGLSYTPEKEEADLVAALDVAEPKAAAAIAAEDFEGAMQALAGLRGPIDAFFDKVTVNDADPAKRTARLGLLSRIRAAVHEVADFSRIEG